MIRAVARRVLARPLPAAAFCATIDRVGDATGRRVLSLAPRCDAFRRDTVWPVRRRGFRLELQPGDFSQWRWIYGLPDATLDSLLELVQPGAHVLDIGANIGLYGLSLARAVGHAGSVHCVEANPVTAARLRRHAALNGCSNITIVESAVGSEASVMTLRHPGWPDSGSYNLRPAEGDATGPEFTVAVDTLDHVAQRASIAHVDLIKVDVEGWEADVILGARELIARCRPTIVFEYTPRWYEKRLSRFVEAMEWLGEMGYRMRRLDDADGKPFNPVRQLETVLGNCDVVAVPG